MEILGFILLFTLTRDLMTCLSHELRTRRYQILRLKNVTDIYCKALILYRRIFGLLKFELIPTYNLN